MPQQFDLVVIGMGSAGTRAAEYAARDLGLKVAAVERHRVGGDRTWTGSLPSKALLASAEVAHTVGRAAEFGIDLGGREPTVDLDAVWGRIKTLRATAGAWDDSVERFEELGVEMVLGSARLTGAHEVTVELPEGGSRSLAGRFVLICTGSRPAVPTIPGMADVEYLTSETIFELDRPPPSLVMIGGGPQSVELAQGLVRLGVPTTVLERDHRLLPRDEPELSERLARVLRGEGVELHLSVEATEVRPTADGVVVDAGDELHVEAAGLYLGAGRVAEVEALGLGRFGIQTDASGVRVDGRSRTIVPNIYVVGDAARDRPNFTHAAEYDAMVAVRDMMFPGKGLATDLVPWCTFTSPELAHVGHTAAEARERFGKRSVKVHRAELDDNARARAEGITEGALIVVTVNDTVAGAHILAPHAGEMIHELAVACRLGLKLSDLSDTVHVHPTLSASIGEIIAADTSSASRRLRALARLNRWFG